MPKKGTAVAGTKKQTPAKKKRPHRNRTKATKLKLGLEICREYEEGDYTIESICKSRGVPYRSFYRWADPTDDQCLPELAEAYKKAKDGKHRIYMEALSRTAKTSLQKMVEGYEVEEKHTEMKAILDKSGNIEKLIPIQVRTSKKHIHPNVTACIFALKNTDPNDFKDRHELELGDETRMGLYDYIRAKGQQIMAEKGRRKGKGKKAQGGANAGRKRGKE